MTGLYVHFPWCIRKCPYCDFNSHPVRGSLDEAGYVDALIEDTTDALENVAVRSIPTVFLGGGTPSLFSPASIERLLAMLAPWLAEGVEITMEANPGTTEHHDLAAYGAAGVNRLSFGSQSFDDAQLRRLGRIHSAAETRQAYARARAAGFQRINLDLMYALPRQTVKSAMADLDSALELEPEHLSWYQLALEAKTPFGERPPRLPGETAVTRMEAAGHDRLTAAGFSRYEVSAWARPDEACRHNLNYWTFGDYIGVGAGAHGKLSVREGDRLTVTRTTKASQPRLYLAAPAETRRQVVETDALVLEFLMNALRLSTGVSFGRFESMTGLPRSALEPAWALGVERGLLAADRVAATPAGYRYLDAVLRLFVD
jgi:oxygen-independent coproporphyrinogen-3 oxidase